MKPIVLALALAAGLALAGCAHMSLQEVSDFLDRVNARIVSVDEFAHKFCPSLTVVNASAKSVACAAKASGTTQTTLNRAISYGRTFCENPTSSGIAGLTKNVATGVRAVLAADAAGCSAQ